LSSWSGSQQRAGGKDGRPTRDKVGFTSQHSQRKSLPAPRPLSALASLAAVLKGAPEMTAAKAGEMILDVNEFAIIVALLALIAIGCTIGFIACRRWWRK
jgi:hypothetical protein